VAVAVAIVGMGLFQVFGTSGSGAMHDVGVGGLVAFVVIVLAVARPRRRYGRMSTRRVGAKTFGTSARRVDGTPVSPEEFEQMIDSLRGRVPDDVLARIEGRAAAVAFGGTIQGTVGMGDPKAPGIRYEASFSGLPGQLLWRLPKLVVIGR
jgi:hypothetical protein